MNHKRNQGITLIALVITIIVLLILAGISIAALSGDNSVINKAAQARQNTIEAQEKEQSILTQMSAAMNVDGMKTSEGIIIPAGFAISEKEGANSLEDGLVIVDSAGNEYVWIEVPNKLIGPAKFGPNYPAGTTNTSYDIIENKLVEYSNYRSAVDDYWTDLNGIKAENGADINSK